MRGGVLYEKNLSAEETAQKKRTRLHEKNVRQKRQKGFSSQESKGQKETFPLTSQTTNSHLWSFCFTKRRLVQAMAYLYTEVLKNNRDFQNCYQRGRRVVSRTVIVYARQNRLPCNRLGITTSKKVGNAVCRSRARRIIRQAWREVEMTAPVGLDLVIVAKSNITEIDCQVLCRWMRKYGIPALHQIYAGMYQEPVRRIGK